MSHRDLERARSDPRGFLSSQQHQKYYGTTRFQCLRRAIGTYHKPPGGINVALEYLESAFAKKRFRSLDEYRAYLTDYHHAFLALGVRPFIVLRNMELRVSNGLTLGGQIDRADITREGCYCVWVFTEHALQEWERELRFPLIQDHYAKQLAAPLAEVSVGVYAFSEAVYSCMRYDAEQVAGAYAEAKRVGEDLTRIAGGFI